MTATERLERKVDKLQNKRAQIELSVSRKAVYRALQDKTTVVGLPYDKVYKEKPSERRCHEYYSCCGAQGSCYLPPLHTGPHILKAWGWAIYTARASQHGHSADVTDLDIKRLPRKYQRLIKSNP